MRRYFLGVFLAMVGSGQTLAQDQPLNVAEWGKAIQIIENARSLVSQGWYQGDAIVGSNCLATALEQGWKQSEGSLVDFDYARLAVNQAIDAPPLASLALPSDPLSTPYWGRYYMYWNDSPGRTQDDVLSSLSDAVGIAKKEMESASARNYSGEELVRFDQNMMQALGLAKMQ